ncbi:hypothetical protein SVAN01_00666 [Stagonosporopsis vannaccii]|nr:hypothetical protein SVAN01_00666 [Stagonosporopsis vannaccii]
MAHTIAPLRPRPNARNHRRAPYTLTASDPHTRPPLHEEEEDPADAPLLKREHRRRTVMTNSHRRFHRRAPQEAGTNVKTVNVEVVATVDTAGNVVAQTTVTQPDSPAPTEATPVLPVTDAAIVSAPSAPPDLSVPAAAADDAASTPEVPSTASLPAETQPAVPSAASAPSTPPEPSEPALPSVAAVPTVASEPVLPSAPSVPSLPSAPSVPSVPAVPSVSLPSVPSVPPFPSTLTVPAYPFASPSAGEVAVNAAAVSSATSAEATMEPSVVAALTAADNTNSTTSSISTSTSISSSMLASSPTLLSTMSGFTYMSSPVVMVASATAISASASQSGSSPSTTDASVRATPTESLDAAGSSSFYGEGGPGWVGGGASATGSSSAATDAAAAGNSNSGPTTPLDTPQVVGSVVGSLAGAALILAIILMLLRRHKRRQGGALQLTDSHPADHEQAMRQVQAVQQVRAPAPARASLVPSAFLNRFSGLSKSTAETTSPTERSFQRVSGRKLPSAFSEGMTSDQFVRGGHMSDSSFYQDDQGTYGGPGLNKEYGGGFGKEIGESSFAGAAGTPNVRPSPARTPVIHHPDNNPFDDTNRTLSPPMSPNPFSDPPLRGALGRSLHSADGSRSSRFTENV